MDPQEKKELRLLRDKIKWLEAEIEASINSFQTESGLNVREIEISSLQPGAYALKTVTVKFSI